MATTPRHEVLKRQRREVKVNVSHCGLVSGLILFRAMMSSMVFSTFSGWMLRADCSSYKWQEQTDSSRGGESGTHLWEDFSTPVHSSKLLPHSWSTSVMILFFLFLKENKIK